MYGEEQKYSSIIIVAWFEILRVVLLCRHAEKSMLILTSLNIWSDSPGRLSTMAKSIDKKDQNDVQKGVLEN